MSLKLTFENNNNVHYEACIQDNLPREIRGRARWTKIGDKDWSYAIHIEEKLQFLEYISDMWYWTVWSTDAQRYFTNLSQKIRWPELFGLGTKNKPILSTEVKRRLEKASAIEELSDGQEEGSSTRRKGLGSLDPKVIDQILS